MIANSEVQDRAYICESCSEQFFDFDDHGSSITCPGCGNNDRSKLTIVFYSEDQVEAEFHPFSDWNAAD